MHGNTNIENIKKVIQESLKFKLYPAAVHFKDCLLDLAFFFLKAFMVKLIVESIACHIFLLGMSTLTY